MRTPCLRCQLPGLAVETYPVQGQHHSRDSATATKQLQAEIGKTLQHKRPERNKQTQERSQRDEKNMKTFDRHRLGGSGVGQKERIAGDAGLAAEKVSVKDWIRKRKAGQEHQSRSKEDSTTKGPVNQLFLMVEVHENRSHQTGFEARDQQPNDCIRTIETAPTKVEKFKFSHRNREHGANEQDKPDQHIELGRLLDCFW